MNDIVKLLDIIIDRLDLYCPLEARNCDFCKKLVFQVEDTAVMDFRPLRKRTPFFKNVEFYICMNKKQCSIKKGEDMTHIQREIERLKREIDEQQRSKK